MKTRNRNNHLKQFRTRTRENQVAVIALDSHKVPEFKETKNKDWILYGEDNKYPDYLLELFNRSAKHNAILTGKVHYIVGNGFEVDKTGLNVEAQAKFEDFLTKINPNDDLNDLLDKIATDIEIFNGFAIEIIPTKGTVRSEFYHIDFNKIRVGKNRDKLYYSNDWNKSTQSLEKTGFRELEVFNPNTKRGVYYWKKYRPGNTFYPIPEYIGAIPYIEMDFEISNFHLNNIKNGFVAGTLLNFANGEPTLEDQARIEAKIKSKFTGTDKAGQIVLTFSDGHEKAPSVSPLQPNNFDKLFDTLNKTVQQEIFTGHKVTSPMLFGVKTEGQLGGRTEIVEAFELFQNGYISPKQKIIEDVFNYLFSLFGFEKRFRIAKTEPIGRFQFGEQTLVNVMTKDEIREKSGLPKLGAGSSAEFRFSKEDNAIDVFKKFGRKKQDFVIYKKTDESIESLEQAKVSEISIFRSKFAVVLSPLERSIIDALLKDPKLNETGIAQFLSKPLKDIIERVKSLLDRGLISGNIGENTEVSAEGQDIIQQEGAPTETIEVLYSYEVRSGLGADVIETTRDFCRQLISLDKLYTREEIEKISAIVGRDVWSQRGGFYHNPSSDVDTPYCRHIWQQNIVRKK